MATLYGSSMGGLTILAALAAAACVPAALPAGPTATATPLVQVVATSPLPALAPPSLIDCRQDGRQATAPARVRDDRGLPLPGSLAIGERVAALSLLQGRPSRVLLGDGAAHLGDQGRRYVLDDVEIEALILSDVTPKMGTNGQAIAGGERLTGARITASAGLTNEAARAWLAAMAPCTPLPDLATVSPVRGSGGWDDDSPGDRRMEDTAPLIGGFYVGDSLTLIASRVESPLWQTFAGSFREAGLSPSLRTPIASDRWVGVMAIGVLYLR